MTGEDREPDLGITRHTRKRTRFTIQAFSSLRNPVYRLFFAAGLGQAAAMNMEQITRSLLIYRLTGSAVILGMMSLANAIPQLGLSLFGGVAADRFQKKYVILICQIGQGIVSLGVALALATGFLSSKHPGSWWLLVLVSLFKGSFQGFLMPARQSLIPEIIGREQIMNAVALNSMGQNVLQILAPALAGFLIDAAGFAPIYFISSTLYFLAAIFIAFLPLTGKIISRSSNPLAAIVEGLQYIRRETIILPVLVSTLIIVMLSQPYQMLMPIFTDDILKVGAKGLGMLRSVAGIGAIVGSFTLASLPNKKRGLLLLASGLVLGLALLVFSFSHSWYLSLGIGILIGLGQVGRRTLCNVLLQSYTKSEYLGRVMSVNFMDQGLGSLGTFLDSLVAEAIGAPWALGSFAAMLVFISVLQLLFSPRVRKLD